MDAMKFVKEYLRMCTKVDECEDCPVYKTDFCTVPAKERSQESAEEIVELVEEWPAAHPIKTRSGVFLSHYPNAEVDEDGVLKVCPKVVEGSNYMDSHKCGLVPCAVCHKAYWSVAAKEVE